MIALYLLAAHAAGDFLLRTRWQPLGRLDPAQALVYCLPFTAALVVIDPAPWRAAAFIIALYLLHLSICSRRYPSTLGDVIQWTLDRWRAPDVTAQAWIDYLYAREPDTLAPTEELIAWRLEKARGITDRTLRWPPPNPWPGTPLMIDQTLHILSFAVLAGVLL